MPHGEVLYVWEYSVLIWDFLGGIWGFLRANLAWEYAKNHFFVEYLLHHSLTVILSFL